MKESSEDKVFFVFYSITVYNFLRLIWMCVCAGCGSNGVESRVLPAVRAPVKSGEPSVSLSPDTKEQSSSSQTAAEAWLQEAHREAGFSKPYTVSLWDAVCFMWFILPNVMHMLNLACPGKVSSETKCWSQLFARAWLELQLLLFHLHLRFPPGVVGVSAGAAPAEGGVSASAARQAACTEKRTAETQADDHTRGATHHHHLHHHSGNHSLLYLPLQRGQRSGSNVWLLDDTLASWRTCSRTWLDVEKYFILQAWL